MFQHKRSLKQHRLVCSEQLIKSKCEYCDKEFTTTRAKKYHIQTQHMRTTITKVNGIIGCFDDKQKSTYCTKCHKSFKTLSKHDCEKTRFKCQKCSKAFQYSDSKYQHMCAPELREKCVVCEKMFVSVSSLKKHMERNHKVKNLNPSDVIMLAKDVDVSDRQMLKILKHIRITYGRNTVVTGTE